MYHPFRDTLDSSLTETVKSIQKNNTSETWIRVEGDDLNTLVPVLKKNTSIHKLTLMGNSLNDGVGMLLYNLLASNHTLKILDISDCSIDPRSLIPIFSALANKEKCTLECLVLKKDILLFDGIWDARDIYAQLKRKHPKLNISGIPRPEALTHTKAANK